MRIWPRSIRGQLLVSMLLLETVAVGLFALVIAFFASRRVQWRMQSLLEYEVSFLALESREAILSENLSHLRTVVQAQGMHPGLDWVRVTDVAGHVLYSSQPGGDQERLSALELAQIRLATEEKPHVFQLAFLDGEAVMPIYTGGVLRGFAWVEIRTTWSAEMFTFWLRTTGLIALIWGLASVGMVLVISRDVSRPLALLLKGTRSLATDYDPLEFAPLHHGVENEIGDLIDAFNQMMVTLARQREGLDDTLSLLDSMLLNAPIGLVFFDQRSRILRSNPVFAELIGVPEEQQIGRALKELCPAEVATSLEEIVGRTFFLQEAVHNHEVHGRSYSSEQQWTWLLHTYPVWSGQKYVRSVGMILIDITERRLAQDALRKSEKLAATGRLAASVAHEINNPLEAVTNLIFLLKNHCHLEADARGYVEMAEHEVRRIAEITQQTLRFFRQPTRPGTMNVAELLNAVLDLYRGRVNSLNVHVERRFDASLELFCYSGELRQVFANLIGNALDACQPGTHLWVRAHASHNWRHPEQKGIRFCVADRGCGMEKYVRDQIFEAFFTTKEATGTGLGLWVSHEIVRKHGGMIHVRSRAQSSGKTSGTVFELFFPDDPALLEAVHEKVMPVEE